MRRALREQVPRPAKKRGRRSRLDPFKPYLERRHQEYALGGVRLLDEIKAMGYAGGIDVVRRFIRSLDPHAGAREDDRALRDAARRAGAGRLGVMRA